MRPSPLLRFFLLISLLALNSSPITHTAEAADAALTVDVVFVARAHLATPDDIFQDELGPAGQFGSGLPKFAPGSRLMIRQSDGTLITLVDGANPNAYLGLIDVQAPDVSFDGTQIIFAGATTVDPQSAQYGWRLYEINVDGTGLHQLNIADRTFTSVPNNNPNAYNWGNAETYGWWNDLFPAYLADGRIVFASTRYPLRAHYDERHTYNLYVVDADGSDLHRITTDRGGFLHPTPLPDGRILATRWWNNFNQPSSRGIFNRIDNRPYNYTLPDGTFLFANPVETFNPTTGQLPLGYAIRQAPNTWHLMALNPDGTQLGRFAFTPYGEYARADDSGLDTYTAAQPTLVFSGTDTYIAFTSQPDSTMVHSTFHSGIRVARPGVEMLYANNADAIAGLTYDQAWNQGNDGPPYALHPAGLPDGAVLFSYATGPTSGLPASGNYIDPVTGRNFSLQGSNLQYQLYTMNLDGSGKALVPTSLGVADAMDAKPIVARVGWTALPDTINATPTDDPRYGNLPPTMPEYPFILTSPANVLTATIHNPNIYANAPLTLPFINNSPLPGSIAFAQVYIDANRFTGAYCYDYPGNPEPCNTFRADNQVRAVLWTQVPVSLDGEFTATVPADIPGFVVLRDINGRAVSGDHRNYISIAQGNAWARPGETVTCVGCHFGHVSGSVESVEAQAEQGLTNVAPYASVSASSYHDSGDPDYQPFVPAQVNDRRGWVPEPGGGSAYQDDLTGWMAEPGQAVGEWVELTWPVPMTVTQIRLVGPPPLDGDWGGFGQYSSPSPYHITAGMLRFYLDGAQVGSQSVGQVNALEEGLGTLITLAAPLRLDRLRFTVTTITGKWWWEDVAALNEIEVIGQAAETYTVNIHPLFLPMLRR